MGNASSGAPFHHNSDKTASISKKVRKIIIKKRRGVTVPTERARRGLRAPKREQYIFLYSWQTRKAQTTQIPAGSR